jgi:hypothetical protein
MSVHERSLFLTVPERFMSVFDHKTVEIAHKTVENGHKTVENAQERSGTVNGLKRS